MLICCKRSSGGQHVLRVVVGIEHDQLRRRRLDAGSDGDRDQAGGGETTEAVHLGASNSDEMWNEIGRPGDIAGLQPAGHEAVAAMIDKDLFDQELVGF